MAIQVTYPGVYIDEFEPAAPIQGVGTSVAAFLGLNAFGPPNKPTLLTSWDAYLKTFASLPPVAPEDDDYLWYAVRGFFANGGQTCFVTAVSNATPDSVVLTDENAKDTITVTARSSGHTTPPINVTAAAANTVAGVSLFAPAANVANAPANAKSVDVVDAAKAAQFLAGDAVVIADANKNEPATIARTSGTVVYLTDVLQNAYTNATLKLAPLASFAKTFRVVDNTVPSQTSAAGLVLGSIVTLSQGGGAAPHTTVITNARSERISTALTTYRVTVKDGINGFTLYATNPINLQSEEFDLTVSQRGMSFPYSGLSMNPGHPRYFATVVNGDVGGLVLAQPIDPPNGTALPKNRPKTPPGGGATRRRGRLRREPDQEAHDRLRTRARVARRHQGHQYGGCAGPHRSGRTD